MITKVAKYEIVKPGKWVGGEIVTARIATRENSASCYAMCNTSNLELQT